MSQLFCVDIPQFIYAQGIPGIKFKQIFLVQVAKDEYREGVRPFSQTVSLMTDLCEVLKLDLKVLEISDPQIPSLIQQGDAVDIQIISRLKGFRVPPNVNVLCVQVEHVNLMRPTFIRLLSASFRKRFDLNRRLLWNRNIRNFFTLAPKSLRNIFLEEKLLNHETIREIRAELFLKLSKNPGYEWLNEIRETAKDGSGIVVLLRAEHFGGSIEFNKKILEFVFFDTLADSSKFVIVKNHPSDPFAYSSLGIGGENWIFLDDLKSRFFPIELLVEGLNSYRFIGVESTVYLSLSQFVEHPTIIAEHENWKPKREIEYINGEIREMYLNEILKIQVDSQ